MVSQNLYYSGLFLSSAYLSLATEKIPSRREAGGEWYGLSPLSFFFFSLFLSPLSAGTSPPRISSSAPFSTVRPAPSYARACRREGEDPSFSFALPASISPARARALARDGERMEEDTFVLPLSSSTLFSLSSSFIPARPRPILPLAPRDRNFRSFLRGIEADKVDKRSMNSHNSSGLIGSLRSLTHTRADLMFSVGFLSQLIEKSTKKPMNAAK